MFSHTTGFIRNLVSERDRTLSSGKHRVLTTGPPGNSVEDFSSQDIWMLIFADLCVFIIHVFLLLTKTQVFCIYIYIYAIELFVFLFPYQFDHNFEPRKLKIVSDSVFQVRPC